MVLDAFNPRIGIQVLVQRQLEHRTPSVSCDDDRASEEVHPDPVPPLSVRRYHSVLVGYPVIVPPEECGGVMNAKNVSVLHFEPSVFDLSHDPRERT